MLYLSLKHLHLTAVVLSGLGFFVRGLWMLLESPLLQRRWVRIVPHVVDAVLLATATALAVLSYQYPFVQGWLTAKVLALVLYIVCGTIAIKRGKTKAVRSAFFVVSLAIFAYIGSVAVTRSPLGFFA